jgi:hypothetical protein
MNVGEKLKSRFEEDVHCLGIDTKSKDHAVKAEKPVAKEAPHASFAHVDYAKLALLKPAATIGSGVVKAFYAASATLADPSVKKDLAAVKTVAAPLIKSGGATIATAAVATKCVLTMVNGAETMAASLGTAQVELTPFGAASFAVAEVGFLASTVKLAEEVPKAIHDGRAAAPVVREAGHHVIETFKKNLGW